MRHALHRLGLLALGALLVSCAAGPQFRNYEGERLPADRLAVLSTDAHLHVQEIDGRAPIVNRGIPEYLRYELTPGRHVLSLTYAGSDVDVDTSGKWTRRRLSTTEAIPLAFEFRQGRRYELHYQVLYAQIAVQVVDVTDGFALRNGSTNWGMTAGSAF